jgi:hypothetical protein
MRHGAPSGMFLFFLQYFTAIVSRFAVVLHHSSCLIRGLKSSNFSSYLSMWYLLALPSLLLPVTVDGNIQVVFALTPPLST